MFKILYKISLEIFYIFLLNINFLNTTNSIILEIEFLYCFLIDELFIMLETYLQENHSKIFVDILRETKIDYKII